MPPSTMLKRLPLITVGIPTKNNSSTIRAVLDSLENQDYPKEQIEVVFVDGLSSDRTVKLIKSWSSRNSHRYHGISVEVEDSNIPRARNRCVEKASGRYILFWDADVVAPQTGIKTLLHHLNDRKVAVANYSYGPDKPGFIDKVLKLEQPSSPSYVKAVVMGFTIIRKDVFKKVGYFNEKLDAFEDLEFCRRVANANLRILMDPSVRLRHLKKPYGIRSFVRDNFSRRSKYVITLIKTGSKLHLLRVIYYILLPLNFLGSILVMFFFCWKIGYYALLASFLYMFSSIIWHFRKATRSRYGLLSPFVHLIGGLALAYGVLRHSI